MAVFDSEAASSLVKELRATVATGKTKSYEWRVSQLKNLLKMADDKDREICASLFSDLSKPETESFLHEIALMKASCKLALKELKNWMKPEKVKTSITTFPSSAEIVSEPLGVVLVISAWNYPFLLSLDPVIGAIAAGNAVVLKPSEVAAATSSLLAKYLGEYMDSSAIKVVEGAVSETSALLEQKWDKIFYTGNGSENGVPARGFPLPKRPVDILVVQFHRYLKYFNHFLPYWVAKPVMDLLSEMMFIGNGKVGSIIMAAAAKHLTPVVLELGGKSPVVVDSNINLKVAARRIVSGKWGINNGQACIAPDYIITTKDYAPTLLDALKLELVNFYGEDPLKTEDLSRIVSSNHFSRLTKLLNDDKVSGKLIHGGQTDESNLKIAPTIFLDAPEDSLIMKEEIFGPLLPIITVEKVEDSIGIINSRSKPLAAYLFTNDKKLTEEFVSNISAGGLVINDIAMHLTVDTLPFGGVGESGMGAYHGQFSFDAFSHKKAVLRRSFFGDATARYPPYTPEKLRLLKALLEGSILGIIRALFGWSKV